MMTRLDKAKLVSIMVGETAFIIWFVTWTLLVYDLPRGTAVGLGVACGLAWPAARVLHVWWDIRLEVQAANEICWRDVIGPLRAQGYWVRPVFGRRGLIVRVDVARNPDLFGPEMTIDMISGRVSGRVTRP